MSYSLPCPRNTDQSILDGLAAISDAFPPRQLTISFIGGFSCPLDEAKQLCLSNPDAISIQSASAYWPAPNNNSATFTFSYSRTPDNTVTDPLVDRYSFSQYGAEALGKDGIVELTGIASILFNARGILDYGDKTLIRQQSRLAGHSADIAKELKRGIEKSIKDFTVFVQSQQLLYDQKRAELDTIYNQRKERLESEISEERNLLIKQTGELPDEKKKFEDKSSTLVRRELRREAIANVKAMDEKFRLSDDTNSKRGPIHIAFGSLSSIFMIVFVVNGFVFNNLNVSNDDSVPVLLVKTFKILLPLAGFFATVFVYIRWMNTWAQKHAEFEFSQRQFAVDINRASWAVESALEWKQAGGAEVPEHLLQGLTRGLFDRGSANQEENKALDELASALIGSASKIRLNIAGNEVEIGQKGINTLNRER